MEEGWDWLFIFLQDVLLKQIFRDRDRDRDRYHNHSQSPMDKQETRIFCLFGMIPFLCFLV